MPAAFWKSELGNVSGKTGAIRQEVEELEGKMETEREPMRTNMRCSCELAKQVPREPILVIAMITCDALVKVVFGRNRSIAFED